MGRKSGLQIVSQCEACLPTQIYCTKGNDILQAMDMKTLTPYYCDSSINMKDIKTLDIKKYVTIEASIDEIGRMLGGWIRSAKQG